MISVINIPKSLGVYKNSNNNKNGELEDENKFNKNVPPIKYITDFKPLTSPENEKTFSSKVPHVQSSLSARLPHFFFCALALLSDDLTVNMSQKHLQ
jgi:hypothetical protein